MNPALLAWEKALDRLTHASKANAKSSYDIAKFFAVHFLEIVCIAEHDAHMKQLRMQVGMQQVSKSACLEQAVPKAKRCAAFSQ